MGGAVLMFAITDRKRSREFAAWFQGQQIPLVLATPGQGTATTEVLDWLGLEATEKVVLMLVAPQSRELVRRAGRAGKGNPDDGAPEQYRRRKSEKLSLEAGGGSHGTGTDT